MWRRIPAALERIVIPALATGAMALYILAGLRKRSPAPISTTSLTRLKKRLLNQRKSQIDKMLGQPRAVDSSPEAVWYYPVDQRQHLAMAITFSRDRVTDVEFFRSPLMLDPDALHPAH